MDVDGSNLPADTSCLALSGDGVRLALSLPSSNEPGELWQWLRRDSSTLNIVIRIVYYYYFVTRDESIFSGDRTVRAINSLFREAALCLRSDIIRKPRSLMTMEDRKQAGKAAGRVCEDANRLMSCDSRRPVLSVGQVA